MFICLCCIQRVWDDLGGEGGSYLFSVKNCAHVDHYSRAKNTVRVVCEWLMLMQRDLYVYNILYICVAYISAKMPAESFDTYIDGLWWKKRHIPHDDRAEYHQPAKNMSRRVCRSSTKCMKHINILVWTRSATFYVTGHTGQSIGGVRDPTGFQAGGKGACLQWGEDDSSSPDQEWWL